MVLKLLVIVVFVELAFSAFCLLCSNNFVSNILLESAIFSFYFLRILKERRKTKSPFESFLSGSVDGINGDL